MNYCFRWHCFYSDSTLLLTTKKYSFSSYTVGFCQHVFLYTVWVPGAHGGWKRVLDPLKLGYRWLWVAMCVQGIKPESSVKATNALHHWAISPPPSPVTFCHLLGTPLITFLGAYLFKSIYILAWYTFYILYELKCLWLSYIQHGYSWKGKLYVWPSIC